MDNISELTDRQIKILKAIIDDYIQSGNAIGSEFLEKKFKLGFSPATIRNEMVVLGKLGFIGKSHFSSGRVPTPKAFRLYINSLLPKKTLSTSEEVSIKNEVWDFQDNTMRFLEETTAALAKKSKLLSVVFLDSGFRFYSGINNFLGMKEFEDFDASKDVFSYLENYTYWLKILHTMMESDSLEVQVLIGEDYLYQPLYVLGGVFCPIENKNFKGAIGVLGPCRIEYSSAMPLVTYTANIVREVLQKNDGKTK
jgi:heat-inducible transcriptional repressor